MELNYVILNPDQIAAWKAYDLDGYNDYVSQGLFDEATGELWDFPGWMVDGEINGPFDFTLHPSQATWGN